MAVTLDGFRLAEFEDLRLAPLVAKAHASKFSVFAEYGSYDDGSLGLKVPLQFVEPCSNAAA